MSGSAGSSVEYGVGGGGSGDDGCRMLRLDRPLEAPVAGVADTAEVGDVMSVELRDGAPAVVALLHLGALAGSVVPTVRLLECLRQGVLFEAEVVATDGGGSVRVEVRAVP